MYEYKITIVLLVWLYLVVVFGRMGCNKEIKVLLNDFELSDYCPGIQFMCMY